MVPLSIIFGGVSFLIQSDARVSQTCLTPEVNPQAPVTQKIADEVVFRHFQGEGVEFF